MADAAAACAGALAAVAAPAAAVVVVVRRHVLLLPAGFTRGLMEVSIGYAMAHARPFSKQSCQAWLCSCCRRRHRGCASYVRLSGRDLFLRRRRRAAPDSAMHFVGWLADVIA